MKCIECQAVLHDYVDGELSAADTIRVETHVAACAACRAQAESLRALLARARELPRDIAPPRDLWPEIAAVCQGPTRERSDVATPTRRATGIWSWLLPLAAAAAIVALATLDRRAVFPARTGTGWTVASLAGAPRLGTRAVSGEAQLRIGEWVETDAASRAKLAANSVGEVNIEPNSRLRLKTAAATDHTLELDRGTMSAFIWAPPRLFFVDTPAARAVDLGCAYTMTVDDQGNGELHVTLGYVALEHDGREALIPAHAKCRTRRGFGPGTPFADDAPQALRDALARFDFERGGAAAAVAAILEHARPEDSVTLWHLLARTSGPQRAGVYDRLAESHPPPAGVTRDGILAGNAAMREAWGKALGIGIF